MVTLRQMGGNGQVEGSQEQSQFMTPVQPEVNSAPLKHSGPGIASFVIGLVSILLAIVGFGATLAGMAEYTTEGGVIAMPGPDEVAGNIPLVIGSLLILLGLLLSVVGVVLGIVGCVIRHRRRVFAILGLVFNAILLAGTSTLFVIGLIVQ